MTNSSRASYIVLRNMSDAEALGALSDADTNEPLSLDIHGVVANDGWDLTLDFLATNENTRSVILRDSHSTEVERVAATATCPFLEAIQKNGSVWVMALSNVHLSSDVAASFFAAGSTVPYVIFDNFIMNEMEARNFADVIQGSKTVQVMTLSNVRDVYLIPILESISASNMGPLGLCLSSWDRHGAATMSIQNSLTATPSIERFCLFCTQFTDGAFFRPIAQGLIESKGVTAVEVSMCQFFDDEHLQDIIQSKPNLSSLAIRHCNFFQEELSGLDFSVVLKPDSRLKVLDLQCKDLKSFGLATVQYFTAFLDQVKNSNLERLTIGRIASPQMGLALTRAIPRVRLEFLNIVVSLGNDDLLCFKTDILQSIKSNSTLLCVLGTTIRSLPQADESEEPLFGLDEERLLDAYAVRNEGLAQWVANPSTVHQGAWPKALNRAMETGLATVFHAMRACAPSVLGEQSVEAKET